MSSNNNNEEMSSNNNNEEISSNNNNKVNKNSVNQFTCYTYDTWQQVTGLGRTSQQ